jgi:hypothetical protein
LIILGAGMSGCIAGILNSNAKIYEASNTPPTNHAAVLRFRTDSISKITGIPFKKVSVNKAIYYGGRLHSRASPLTANLYSRKVTGKIISRSIWNLAPVERYIAPSNFHSQLLDRIDGRVIYGEKVCTITTQLISTSGKIGLISRSGMPVISTLPMPILSKVTSIHLDGELFKRLPITTARCQVSDCDVNQTIYFPDLQSRLYRVTLTGQDLILEFAGNGPVNIDFELKHFVYPAFGLSDCDLGPMVFGTQEYGKIAPVADEVRKGFMYEATQQLRVFSVGRFAIWKNILLDDVYDDLFQIRRMIEQSNYDIKREMHS